MSMHDPLAAGTPDADKLTSADPIALLESDHEAVEALFRRAEDAGFDASTDVVRDIADLLITHTALEEELVYPLLPQELAGRSRSEHGGVKKLLTALLSASDVAGVLAPLVTDVRAHVSEERAQVFPALEAALSPDERRKLGAKLAAAKGAGSPATDAEYPVADASVSSDDSPDYVEDAETP